jgi:Fe-S-cluster containining protein
VSAWYRDGVRFSCKRCGACCTGRGSIVVVTPREREALARHLGIGVAEFESKHTKTAFDETVLLDDAETGDCEWLERNADGTTGCRVNDAKPDQCRSYPFWPRTLASRETWEDEAKRCKGIGAGEVIPEEEIERRAGLDDALEDLDLLLEELDYEVKDLGARCWLSGDCCDFDAAGHRLYTSEIEARRFAKGVDLAGWDPASRLCPAWKDRRCTAREHRPLACRTYFCDPKFAERTRELTERYVARLKWLHEKHRLAWDYRDLLDHLATIRGKSRGSERPIDVPAGNDRYQPDRPVDGDVAAD